MHEQRMRGTLLHTLTTCTCANYKCLALTREAICPLREAAAALVSLQEGRPSGAPLGSPVMSVDTAKVKVAKNLAPRRLTLPPIWEPRSPRDENTRGSVPAPRREAMEVLDLLGEQLEATSRFNFALRVAAIQTGSTEKVRLRNPTTGIHPRARVVFHGTSWNGAVGISAT